MLGIFCKLLMFNLSHPEQLYWNLPNQHSKLSVGTAVSVHARVERGAAGVAAGFEPAASAQQRVVGSMPGSPISGALLAAKAVGSPAAGSRVRPAVGDGPRSTLFMPFRAVYPA